MEGFVYNTEIKEIEYTNDKQYRNALYTAFCLETEDDPVDIDQKMIEQMDILFLATKNIDIFAELYKNAAYKMISEDMGIGQCILFSYDYFYLFHPVICNIVIFYKKQRVVLNDHSIN